MTMRKVDPRVKVTRRRFLQSSAAAAPAASMLAAGATLTPESAWADTATLSAHEMATLTQMARDTYPHDHIGDASYRKAVTHWDADCAAHAETKAMITSGVKLLDDTAQARFKTDYLSVPAETDRVALLEGMQHGPFFKAVRADLVVSFYNQADLWPKFGYEGPSAQLGGYIHRGFDDIDWLPTATA